ncbi:hypothetical protein BDQ17DRAFT_1345157 [Cyathus striatus]|nr:hypothetical protein BDQ17DRAFT_1345157 [Cyathus striatus]
MANHGPVNSSKNLAVPLLAGYMLNWGLHGALSVQYYDYYITYPEDRFFTKCIVHGIYLLETAQSTLTTYDAFKTFGSGDLSTLSNLALSGLTGAVFGSLIACIGQLYYAYRISVFSKSKIIPCCTILISFLQLAAGIMTGVLVTKEKDVSNLSRVTYYSATAWTGFSAICDILIAASMTYYLMKQETGFNATRRLIRRIVRLTIETGIITATMAILTLLLITIWKTQIYFMAVAGTIPKWYSNTLLVLLNSRARIKENDCMHEVVWARRTLTSEIGGESGKEIRMMEFRVQEGAGSGGSQC